MKRKLPDNLKFLKNDIKSFVQNHDQLYDTPKSITSFKYRKKIRKEGKILKKMRMDAFKRKLPMPTIESLQKEKEDLENIKKKRKSKLDKLRQKRIRKRQKKQLKLKEEEERKKDLDIMNRNDNKVLKELEKKLGMKKKKSGTLPASFQRDNMDYVLNYMEEVKGARTMLEGSNDIKLNKSGKKMDKNKENNIENLLSDNDSKFDDVLISSDEDIDDGMQSIGDDDDDSLSSNEDINHEDDDDDDDDDDAIDDDYTDDDDEEDEEEIDCKNNKMKDVPKKTNKNNKQNRETSLDSTSEDGNENKIVVKEKVNKKLITNKNKQNKSLVDSKEDLKEDIYGRLRDSSGNVVVVSNVYQPPAKRILNNDSTSEVQVLNKQIHAIINRLSEANLSLYIKELSTLFNSHSRAIVSETLSNEILNSALVHTLLPASSLANSAFLIAVFHSNIGIEVSSTFLQLLTSSLLKLLNIEISDKNNSSNETSNIDEFDDMTSSKIKNVLSIFVKLYSFKVIESSLVFEFLNYFLRFSLIDITSLDFMLKEVGFDLRKDDVIMFKALYSKIIEVGENVEKLGGARSIVYKNLLETMRTIKNNQRHKISDYDKETITKKTKDLKILTKGAQSPAIHVTLKDLAFSDKMGKWWLVGSAWAGKLNEDAKTMATHKNLEHDETLKQFEKKLLDTARRHHMNTSVKKMIFCTIMTSTDYRDAFEKLLRLKLTSEQQRDIQRVIINLVIKERPYNPFYAHLAQQFCAYHRKYLMACKFSIWDQLKAIDSLSENQLENFSTYILWLITQSSLQLTVLKVIEFAEMEKSTANFLKKFLTAYFSSTDVTDQSLATTFTYISTDAKLSRFKLGLALFLRRFILKDEATTDAMVDRVRRATRLLEAHSTADVLPSNWTTLDD